MKAKHTIRYFANHLVIVFALVLIWRGIWVLLDIIDAWLFNSNHIITAIISVIIGFLLLYIPDHDLKEIEAL